MDVLIITILVVIFVAVVIKVLNKKKNSEDENNNNNNNNNNSIKSILERIKNETLKNSKKIPLYYVKYEGKVKIGINVEKIKINIDEERKKVILEIPKAKILDASIDDTEFNIIYINKKEISESEKDFYKIVVPKCEEDMVKDIMNNNEVFRIADKNTKEIISGFVTPLIKQINNEYTVEIIDNGRDINNELN